MDYDLELQLHNRSLFAQCAINHGDRVIDIGCGTGHTTREAARLAAPGHLLGIDIDEQSLEKARAKAAAEGLHNVRFEHGDAQVVSFLPRAFDLAMSRYGTMFFPNPVAAFRNIRSALSLEGRLVMMVWQPHEQNEWSLVIEEALGAHFSPQSRDRQHFSLGDPDVLSRVLKGAGFAKIEINEVREPVYYGPDVKAALDWVGSFRFVHELMRCLDAQQKASAMTRLTETMSKHTTKNGVWFEAREWIVTAM